MAQAQSAQGASGRSMNSKRRVVAALENAKPDRVPIFWEYVKPYQREIVDHAHRRELKIVKHTDGNAWSILDDFVEVGFDGFHPVQPQCMDLAEVVEHLDRKPCVTGNTDCRDLLPSGTEEEVEKEVKDAIETAAEGGGHIISSSNSIHPGCRAENCMAVIRSAHKFAADPC